MPRGVFRLGLLGQQPYQLGGESRLPIAGMLSLGCARLRRLTLRDGSPDRCGVPEERLLRLPRLPARGRLRDPVRLALHPAVLPLEFVRSRARREFDRRPRRDLRPVRRAGHGGRGEQRRSADDARRGEHGYDGGADRDERREEVRCAAGREGGRVAQGRDVGRGRDGAGLRGRLAEVAPPRAPSRLCIYTLFLP